MTAKRSFMLIIGILLVLSVFIYLFSQPLLLSILHVNDKTEAATLIDGFTAPVVGIIGAILVFVSFREQVKANRMQFEALNEQRELELLYKFYEELKQDLQRMQGEYGPRYGQSAILDSMMNYAYDNKHVDCPYPEFNHYLHFIFRQFIFISNRIKRSRNLSPSEKVYIIDKVGYLYDLYFKPYHTKLTTVLLDKEFGKQIKNALEEVNVKMRKLDDVHSGHKEQLRREVRNGGG